MLFKLIILVFLCRLLLCSSSKPSCSSVLGTYGVRRDWWTGLNGGYFLDHLKKDRRFISNKFFNTNHQSNFDSPRNFAKYYGQRLSAYFIPRTSGSYTFIATCDSECEILLSNDESRAHKRTIINIDQNHRTKYHQWNKYAAQRSCPQELHGNTIYYVEALHSNYKDQDHVRLRVLYPGQRQPQWIEQDQLVRYSDEPLPCVLLQSVCGYQCGGHEGTLVREVNPITKKCTMPTISTTAATTTATTTTTAITTTTTDKKVTTIASTAATTTTTAVTTTAATTTDKTVTTTASTASTAATTTAAVTTATATTTDKTVTTKATTAAKTSTSSTSSTKTTAKTTAKTIPTTTRRAATTMGRRTTTEKAATTTGITTSTEKAATTILTTTQPTARTPNGPLLNITTRSTSSTSIQVFWHVISQDNLTNIQSYRLNYNENGKIYMYSSIISGDVSSVELEGLKKYTLYCIRILLVINEKEKMTDDCHYARTLQDIPSQPPTVQVRNKALTSILVTWQPINEDNIHGELQGYKVKVTNMNDIKARHDVIKSGSKTRSMTINGVHKRANYCVRVLGFTGKGDGPYSECALVVTWTDDFLPKMFVRNFTGTAFINITWDYLPGYLAGHVIAYRLSYTVSQSKGVHVELAPTHVINVTANTTEITITGLKIFAVYRLEVRPLTRRELGLTTHVAFGATCRCQKYLKALWSPVPPYAVQTETGNPTGIIPKLLSTLVSDSCGFCYEHNQSKVIYELKSSRTKRDNVFDEADDADFEFPIRKSDKTSKDDSEVYIPLLEVPGFAFITPVKTKQTYARDVATSVIDCWPIMVISLAMTLLSGVVMWAVELVENRYQSNANFFKSVTDSVWWSFITMTTVGYGDQIPRTTAGRCIAILWLFIGIVIMSLLVGSITSSLSVKILKEQLYVKRDKKIASVEDPLDYKVLMNVGERASTRTTYQDVESLISALKKGNMEGIIVDMYVAAFRTDLFNGSWYKVSSILEKKFYYGVIINGNAATLARRFNDQSLKTYAVEMKVLQEEREKENVSNQFTLQSQTVRKDIDLLNPRTMIYQLTVFFSLTVLGCVVLVGIFVHSWKKNRQRELQMKNVVQDPREKYLKVKQEMRTVVDNFYKQFRATYVRLKLKHRREKMDFIKRKRQEQHNIVWL